MTNPHNSFENIYLTKNNFCHLSAIIQGVLDGNVKLNEKYTQTVLE